MINLSAFNCSVTIAGSKLFPLGFTVKNFAHDVPAVQVEQAQVADYVMLADGNKFDYDIAAAITVKIAVIPLTNDDENLRALLNSRFGKGSIIRWLPQGIVMTISYPNNRYAILTNGSIISGNPVCGIDSSALQTNIYTFVFNSSSSTSIQSIFTTATSLLTNR